MAKKKFNLAVAKQLPATNRDAEARDSLGQTPLLAAAAHNDAAEVARLIKAGADVNVRDHEGFTPLIRAAIWGNVAMTKSILASGVVNPDVDRYRGLTALMWAAKMNKKDTALVIADSGADPFLKSDSGRSAIEYAEIDNQAATVWGLKDIAEKWRKARLNATSAQKKYDAMLQAGIPAAKDVRLMKPISLHPPKKSS